MNYHQKEEFQSMLNHCMLSNHYYFRSFDQKGVSKRLSSREKNGELFQYQRQSYRVD